MKRHYLLAMKALQISIGILLLFCPTNSTFADQPKSTTEGGRAAGTYDLSNFDNVNLFNGNLNFRLPLLTVRGRGEAAFSIQYNIENRWTTSVGYDGQCPVYVWSGSGGGSLNFSELGLGDRSATYDYIQPGVPCTNDYYQPTRATFVPTFTTADGTTHAFHSVANSGAPIEIPVACFFVAGTNLGKEFVTWDGSAMKLIYDYDVYYNGYTSTLRTSPSGPPLSGGATVLFPNGTRYRMNPNGTTWLEDRNGNRITFYFGWDAQHVRYGLTQIVDSMGRIVSIDVVNEEPYGPHTRITYKGSGGATRTIRVGEFQIWLPNGKTYSFTYNENRELTRVDLPTGGAYEYDWGGDIPQPTQNCHPPNGVAFRYVTERRVKANGVDVSSRTTFSAPNGVTEVNTYDAADHLVSHSKHYFYGDPIPPLPSENPHWTSAAGEEDANGLKGKEYRTEFFAGSGALVRVEDNTWITPRHVTWTIRSETQIIDINARLESKQTTLTDLTPNLIAKTQYSYNQGQWANTFFNVLTDTSEYDYGQGVIGSFIRRSHSEYISYDSGNYQGQPYIPLLLTGQWISSDLAGNTKSSRTQYEYDNYVADTNHAELLDRANIVGHNPSCGTAYTLRGNATKLTRYQNAQDQTGEVSTYSQYDIAGNIIKSIDPRGNTTQFWFTNSTGSQDDGTPDDFGSPDGDAQLSTRPIELSSASQYAYAFPVRVTNALGQSMFKQTDFYTGQAVDVEDANGVVSSSYSEFDSLDRPTKVIRAANKDLSVKAQTVFNYDDTAHVITTASDLNTFGDGVLITKVFNDGLGRTIETRQYEGGTNYIAVQTEYDALGRPYKKSNPFRPLQNETAIWTTQDFDALGRVTSITTPDSAVVSSSYLGNTTTISDQTGKQRKSVTDALGRLVAIYEDPSAGGLNYLTSYSYDVLDNLIGVSQGSQSRSFTYDSLKRLTSTTNPESGTVGYQYDNKGNLLVKTDARGVSAHFAYDSLNRIVRRWYNGSNSVSSTINNTPELPSSVAQTDAANFYYDAQTLPYVPQDYVRGASTGRVVAVTYGGASSTTGDYYGYDEIGRNAQKFQRLGTKDYKLTSTYNVADLPTFAEYPSGHSVSYSYDSVGRTLSFTGTLGDGNTRNYSTEATYSPFGGLTKEKFGTTPAAIYNKLFYNSRGQLAEIRESTSWIGPNDVTYNRGAIVNNYSDLCPGMCGGSNSTTPMTDNNGNLKKQDVYIPNNEQIPTTEYVLRSQQYSYDELNRLLWVRETLNSTDQWRQWFSYDQYGNRTIDTGPEPDDPHTRTWGAVNTNAFDTFDLASKNRLYAPGDQNLLDQNRRMRYDEVGNLTTDTYSGAGTRTYDAENKMSAAIGGPQATSQLYKYDASGQRVTRTVNGVETWAVYGFSGEMVAEYPVNGVADTPQKEYGYRNGQLLITATVTSGWGSAPVLHDNPLVVGETLVQARHITELRDAINALRSHLGLTAYAWQTSATTSNFISAEPILEMRTALDQALGSPANGYNAGLAINQLVKAVHIQELRDRVLGAWISESGVDIRWLITDQLGTPRMILDLSGSLATVSRHDYLPFGEELLANVGGRTTGQGYTASDGARQRFTQKERDSETGLDYFGSRYYSSNLGRFTSPDSVAGSIVAPQTLNLYIYVQNNPIKFVDPTGHTAQDPQKPPDEPLDVERITIHDRMQQIIEQAKKKLEESRNKLRDFWDLPSPAQFPTTLCPTGICQKPRTIYDDATFALNVAEKQNSAARTVMSVSDSWEVSGSAFYVISGSARITADGDVFLDFNTPLSTGLVDAFKDGFSLKEIQIKGLFSYSVTTTHVFGESTQESRRAFFGGGSYSLGGAIPTGAVGMYGGGVYSPSSGQVGVQAGFAKPGVSGGYSWTSDKPTWHFESLRWKPK